MCKQAFEGKPGKGLQFFVIPWGKKQLNSQQCMYTILILSAHLQLSSLFPLSFVLLFTYGEPLE